MRNYIIRRLFIVLISLIGVSMIIFLSVRLIPGDVVQVMLAQQGMGQAQIEQLRITFGLDRPLYIQYFNWFLGVLRGDFGHSLRTSRPILADILLRAPVTFELSILSAVFGIIISIPAGILAAIKKDSFLSLFVQTGSLLGLSIPSFWLGAMIILVSSRYLKFYGGGTFISFFDDPIGNLRMFALPSIAVGLTLSAALTRYTRSMMLEVLGEDYVRTARSKGLRESRVVLKHALSNALIPIITVIGLQLGYLIGGVVIIETVFALPGMGRLVVDAIYQRDYPMIQAVVLIITSMVMLASLIVDILYGLVDPRIRYK